MGDKITKKEFDLIVAKLKDQDLSSEAANPLRDILIRADNVEYLKDNAGVKFLDENVETEKAKVRAITLARETCEELFEPYVQAVLLDPKTDFVKLIEDAFGQGEITGSARLMLQQIQGKVLKVVERFKDLTNKELAQELSIVALKEIYKDEIEPYFARFLKISAQGQALIAEMEGAISDEAQLTNFRVNDLSFPQGRLAAIKSGSQKIENENRPSISIPQSNSLVVDAASCPILSSLSNTTRNFIAKNPETIKRPIEYKGAEHFATPAEHLKFLLGIYSAENDKQQPSQMAYAHEIFVQIRATMLRIKDSQEIVRVFSEVRSFDAEFDAKFNRRNAWLVNAGLTNLNSGKVYTDVNDVVLEMLAGKKEILAACFPQLASVVGAVEAVVVAPDLIVAPQAAAVSGGAASTKAAVVKAPVVAPNPNDHPAAAAAEISAAQRPQPQKASSKKSKESATYVVIIDSSEAFANPKNPMGASAEKVGPYEEKVAKFLAQVRQNRVDGYCVTTDIHPKNHQNFLKNLLQNDQFLKIYAYYVLQKLSQQSPANKVAIKELQGLFVTPPQDLQTARIKESSLEEKQQIIKKLDSLSPFDVKISLPQLLQAPSENGQSVKTVGIKIGSHYYRCATKENDALAISEIALTKAVAIKGESSLVTEVSTWPSHSFDETMYYSENGSISQHFAAIFGEKQTQEEHFGFDEKPEFGINGLIQTLKNQKAEDCVSGSSRADAGGVSTLVFGKGRDKSKENYSPFFSEALGINREAMVKQLQALFEIAKDAKSLTIPVIGIAYDFCVKNYVLDTINFIAPALQALQLIHESGSKVGPENVEDLVDNIANIVEQRIKTGAKDIKAKVSVEEALGSQYSLDSKGELLQINITIPKGATIEIIAQEAARAEMMKAAVGQRGVGFSEPEIENAFNTGNSVSVASASALAASRTAVQAGVYSHT